MSDGDCDDLFEFRGKSSVRKDSFAERLKSIQLTRRLNRSEFAGGS